MSVTTADGITFRNATVGSLEGSFMEMWNSGTDTWDVDTGPWSTLERRRVVLADPTSVKFYTLGHGNLRDGVPFMCNAVEGWFGVDWKEENGDVIEDFQKYKMIKRIWPKLTGSSVNIKFNAAEIVGGAVTSSDPVVYDPNSMVYADPGPMMGRAVGLEITSLNNFRLDGYKIDVTPMGDY